MNKYFKGLVWISLLVTVSVALASCSKKIDPNDMTLTGVKPPEWVLKGSGAFQSEIGRVFYGVGSASGFQNYSLQRITAENRARNDIAKVFRVYTSSLMKDYEASTGADGDISSERHVSQAIKTVTSETLSGVLIVDHWEHPNRGEIFALARLDLNAFKDNISKLKELSKEVREFVKQNAEKLHQELSKEEEKLLKRRGE